MRKNFFRFEFLTAALVLPALYFLSLVPRTTEADTYYEECVSEVCTREEVREMWIIYSEECCGGEGPCSYEEIRELAGGQPWVPQMLQTFLRRGFPLCPGHLGFARQAGAADHGANEAAEGGRLDIPGMEGHKVPKGRVWLFSEPDFKGLVLEIGPTDDAPSLTATRAKLDFKVKSIQLGRLVKKVTFFGEANLKGGGRDVTRTTSNFTGQTASVRVEAVQEPEEQRAAKDFGDDEEYKKGRREGGEAHEAGKAQ
jgi:hypothetical protein